MSVSGLGTFFPCLETSKDVALDLDSGFLAKCQVSYRKDVKKVPAAMVAHPVSFTEIAMKCDMKRDVAADILVGLLESVKEDVSPENSSVSAGDPHAGSEGGANGAGYVSCRGTSIRESTSTFPISEAEGPRAACSRAGEGGEERDCHYFRQEAGGNELLVHVNFGQVQDGANQLSDPENERCNQQTVLEQ